MKAEYKAAAKINLMLDILRTLDNGYHSLFMVMQSVGLYDTVSVETTDDKKNHDNVQRSGFAVRQIEHCIQGGAGIF